MTNNETLHDAMFNTSALVAIDGLASDTPAPTPAQLARAARADKKRRDEAARQERDRERAMQRPVSRGEMLVLLNEQRRATMTFALQEVEALKMRLTAIETALVTNGVLTEDQITDAATLVLDDLKARYAAAQGATVADERAYQEEADTSALADAQASFAADEEQVARPVDAPAS